MINLGHELAEMGWRVIATTTTQISADQLELLPYAVTPGEGTGMFVDGAQRIWFCVHL